ncbi:MAG TPA: class I SAM-dependent methyltransferase [Polyangiales bacterium]|nr:class I SAM-dependent methyltransferase [Polyangiales bacterium]
MNTAYNPHGAALLDCYRGKADAMLTVHQEGERDDVPAAFWLRTELDPLELLGLDLCRGRVLDLGAGAGVHALELQRRGMEVTAVDIASECVEIMRDRGVQSAYALDMFELDHGEFDTIIALCNGLDKVGRLEDLPRFLDRARSLLAPGGQLIADSFDLRVGASAGRLAALTRKHVSGRYFGELDLRFEYNGESGAPFSALHVDYTTLTHIAKQVGWTCELIQQCGGHYLVRARPTDFRLVE